MLYDFQDPKYQIEVIHVQKPGAATGVTEPCARLVNKATGKPIPFDEPVFILRGQDAIASMAVHDYERRIAERNLHTETPHELAVRARFDEFVRFATEHPDLMKMPS